MSIIDDANDRSTLSTSILIPVSSDKTPLSWDGNDATLLGLLHEVGRHYRNKGLFQTLLRDRAVALSNGRLAVEDPNAVYFVSGAISETRSFDDPCPPTVDRITEHNAEVAAGTRTGSAKTVLTAIPDEHKTSIILAKHAVEKEDSTLLHSLSYVFGHAEPSDSILENADGSGLEFLQLLRDRGKRAGPRDKALVSAKFAKIIQEGVKGELTLDTFSAFLKTYKAAKRNIAPASRPPAEAEVEMINIIAVKDPGARELYELKIERTPPGNLDDASKLLLDMLRGRLRCEEIDQVSSDSRGAALITPPATSLSLDPPVAAALAALGIKPSSLTAQQHAALVSAMAPADPRKTDAGKREDIPRDSNGKPSKWVEGMAKCPCGANGGKHLFKDCPNGYNPFEKKERELEKKRREKEKKAAAAAKRALAAEDAAPTAPGGLSEDQLRSALAAFLSGSIPVTTSGTGE